MGTYHRIQKDLTTSKRKDDVYPLERGRKVLSRELISKITSFVNEINMANILVCILDSFLILSNLFAKD